MTYTATFMVEDLESALSGIRAKGLLAKQSETTPDVVFVYGKTKADVVEAVKEFHKTRGLENLALDKDYFASLVTSDKVDDAELLAAVKEPEHKQVAIEANKTEQDLYLEEHPLDLNGEKHPVDDADLLGKVKAGSDFSVENDPIKPSDEAAKVTEAQTQRGGSGDKDSEDVAKAEGDQAKASETGADVVAKATEIAAGEKKTDK